MTDSKFFDGARRERRRFLVAVGLAAVAVVVATSGGPARADWTYELVPSAGLGATDNASNKSKPTPPDSGDVFTTLSGIGRARYRGAKAEHVAGYRLAWMHYFEGRGPDNLTNELSWISTLNLLASLDLKLMAAGTYGQTSGYAPANFDATMPTQPQAVVGGTSRYLGANAGEALTFQRTATNRYIEGFGVTLLRYLGGMNASNIINLDGRVRGEWDLGLNHLGVELLASRIESSQAPGAFILGSAAATWRRELSLSWSGEVGGGAAVVVPPTGTTQIAPVGHVELDYRNLTWFATLVGAQTPTMNVYVGNATINDSVTARLALPLTKSGLAVLGGYGGYVYGRLIGGGRAYDQRVAGGALAVRGTKWPIWTSLDYTISDQNGSMGSVFQSIRRQVILLNVGGTFIFGPGTPPIFPGAL